MEEVVNQYYYHNIGTEAERDALTPEQLHKGDVFYVLNSNIATRYIWSAENSIWFIDSSSSYNLDNVSDFNIITIPITNISTAYDTEYSFTLPKNTKRFQFKIRDGQNIDKMRYAKESGKVATPVEPFFTSTQSDYIYEDNLTLTSDYTLYFASSVSGIVVEIIYWA